MAWMPQSGSGRTGGGLAAASLVAVAAYVALALRLEATTPEDEMPGGGMFRLASVAFVLAILAGLVAAGCIFFAFFARHDRSRVVVSAVALSALAVPLVITGLIADIAAGDHERVGALRVEIENHDLTMAVDYQKAAAGPVHVIIRVTNNEPDSQRIGIMELRAADSSGQPALQFAPNRYPLKDGAVRHYTFPGEGQVVFWTTRKPLAAPVWLEGEAPPRPDTVSRIVGPGQTVRIELSKDLPKGTVLVVFSDAPGDYAAGMWVSETLR